MAGMIKTEDTESEAGSISEEERIRKLFQACDGDGDGYIDSEDLLSICRELNLEQCVGELMQELGADEHGRISYQGFLRRRLELAGQVEAATRRLGRGTATETEEEETEEETEDEGSRGVGRRRGVGDRNWGCGECGAHRGQEGEDDESCAREGRESSGDSGFRRALVVIDTATPTGRQQEYRQPTSSENSLGAGSGGRQERWEFDSGARDLSPEPQAPPPGSRSQSQVQGATNLASTPQGTLATPTQSPSVVNTNPPIPQGGTASLLDMANKLHQAALASLKSEIQDLTGQLKAVTQERDFLERSLSKAQLEKLRLVRDAEERLDSQAQRYEGRLTELHCVIAELSRKIRGHTSRIITEEDEGDEDDSTTAAEEDDDEEVEEVDDEEDEVDEEDGAGSQSVAADTTQDDLSGVGGEEGVETETQDCCELESGRTELVDGEGTVVPDDATDHTQTQDLVVTDVRREEEEEEGLEQQRRLHRKVKELQGNLQQLQIITPSVTPSRTEMAPLTSHGSPECRGRSPQERTSCCPVMHASDGPRRSPRRLSSVPDRGGMVDRWVGTVGEAITSSASHFPPSPQRTSPPQFLPPPPPPLRDNFPSQPKVAERVRIQRVDDGQHMIADHGNITASEMVDLGVCCNSRTAEHLVRDIREESSAQELRHATRCGGNAGSCSSAMSPNAQYQWKGEAGPSQSCITRLPMESSQISECDRETPLQSSCGCLPVLRALELEVERQAGRAEAHRATAELTALSLEECRSACERQALVLSRRGSDIVGLATALSFALPLCRACFILSRVLESRESSGKAAKAKVEEEAAKLTITNLSSGRHEHVKMKSRIPEFQMKGIDSKGSERSRSSKKGDTSTSGGSAGSSRSAEPEKSWLCRKREELGRTWGSKKDESGKGASGNDHSSNSEDVKKGRDAVFVDEGGYGRIIGHGNRSGGEDAHKGGGKSDKGGSTSASSGGSLLEENVTATRADVGCGGVDASDLVRIIEAEAASLVESLDCKMRLLNMAECRTEEMAAEDGVGSSGAGGIPEEDWVLSWDDFNWVESLGKEEEGSPDILRRLGKHISILLKSLSSCGVGLKKAKDMAAEASASEGELGLLPSNVKPDQFPASQGQPGRKADLEVAVLMQELMAMREERAVLRTRIHALEGEREELGRVCMLLKLGRGEEATEVAAAGGSIVPHIPSTKDLIRLVEESGKVTGSVEGSSERLGESGAMVDNVSREQWLERRLQELALTLEQVATSADVRLRQSTAVMNDLRRTNGTLAHSLDRCRRRYQQRLKTLETQMENLIERHASQVRTLRQRINQLEDRNEVAEVGGCKVNQAGGRIGEVSL